MALNFHLLRLFTEVVRYRSVTRAAEVLHISQPAVSKGVRALEEQLGEALVERGSAGMRPTPAGEILARHAASIFLAERHALEELAALKGLEQGVLRVGASTTIGTYMLPPILGVFHRTHPAIELHLTTANTQGIADRMAAWDLDVALVEGPVASANAEFELEPWREDELALIVAPTHPFATSGEPVEPDALLSELFIVREPGSGTREVVAAALGSRDLVPQRTLEIGGTEAIKQLVMAGVGVAIVSAAAAADQVRLGGLCVVPMRDFTVSRMLTRLSVPHRPMSPAARAFVRLLNQSEREGAGGTAQRKALDFEI